MLRGLGRGWGAEPAPLPSEARLAEYPSGTRIRFAICPPSLDIGALSQEWHYFGLKKALRPVLGPQTWDDVFDAWNGHGT